MDFASITEFINFDVETNYLTLRLDFLSPEMQRVVEESVVQHKRTKIHFKYKFKESVQDHQRKCWYGSLNLILKSDQHKTKPFAEDLEEIDDWMRENLFPMKIREDQKLPPRPMRMKEMSKDQMGRVIQKLHRRYSYLTVNQYPIDFTQLKGV